MADAIGPAKRSPTEFLKAVSDVTTSETGACRCLGGVSGMARWLGSRTPRDRVPRSVAARWRQFLPKVLTRGAVPPQVTGRPVVVKLNTGVDYRGVLACLDGYMNIAMEQTEEYVNGQLKNKYGDAFIRGNNVLYISTVGAKKR